MISRYIDLDVRPILRAGGEPFAAILETIDRRAPDEGLRLFATFKPTPLFAVLGAKGFGNEATEMGGGDWQVLFYPAGEASDAPSATPSPDHAEWPAPVREIDGRDLDPPEPMVKILAAAEEMQSGEVLAGLLGREPVFLFPELAKRGHAWRGGFDPDGTTYRVLVRVGGQGHEQ
jgi:TusA-related sulfurtransferase